MYAPYQTDTFSCMRSFWPQALRVAALTLPLLLGACDRSQLSEEEYLQSGRQAFLIGDFKTSTIHLKNLLQINPKNAEARFLLGQIYLASGNPNAALLALERARDLGFNKTALLVPMGRAYLLSGRHDAVLEQSFESDALGAYDRAYLYSLRGYAYIAAKEARQAQAAFDQALALQPNLDFALIGQIRLALAQGDLAAARERSETALGLNPESPKIHLIVGEIASLGGDRPAAEAAFTRALELDPGNFGALSKRALIRMASGSMEGGRADLEELRRLAPTHPKTLYAIGLYHYTIKEYTEAQEVLDQLISKEPDHDRGMFLLGATNLALRNEEQGLRYLEQFITRNPDSLEATNKLVIAYLRRGETERAQQLLQSALRYHPKDARLLPLQALNAVALNRMAEAVRYLRQAERLNPDAEDLQLVLGLSLLQADDPEGAIEPLNKAAASDADSRLAENIRILAYLKAGDAEQALSAALKLVAQNPDSALQRKLLGYVYHTRDQMDEAEAVYETALQLAPGDPAASHNLAIMSRRGGSDAQARALYEQVLEHHPQHVATLVRLGRLEQAAGETEAGISRLRRALELDDHSVEARLALARYLFASGSPADAVALMEAAPSGIQFHPGILAERAKIQAAMGQPRLAANTLGKLTSRYPSLAAAWLQLGLLQEHIGERDAAAQSFVQAMRHRSEHPLFGVSTTRGLYRTGREELAKELADRLQADNPKDVNVRLLQGWLEQRAGRHDAAVSAYRSVHAEHPSKASTLALAGAYADSDRIGEGIGVLRDWLEQHPDDQKVSIALAQLQINSDRSEEAVETLLQLLVHRPEDVGLLNDIAQLLRTKDPNKALVFARRAHALAPDLPAVMDTLGTLFLDNGQVQQSVEVLSRAVAKQPDSPAMRLHLAQALVADGAPLRGRSELEQLLVRYPDAPERAEAKALLKQLSAP